MPPKSRASSAPTTSRPPDKPRATTTRRYDRETGALTNEHPPPETSAADHRRFLRNPDEDADHPLFGYPACIHLLIGCLGSGKSSCIWGLLEEASAVLKPSALGRILYYSGSSGDRILDAYRDDASRVEVFTTESKESFQETLRSLLADAAVIPHAQKKHNIIVVEDAANDPELLPANVKSETPLGRIAMSLRHLPCTLIVSAQKLSAMPAFLRTNATHLFVFRTKSEAERKDVLKAASFSKKEFERALDTLTEAGQFIWANNHKRTLVRGWTTPLVH